LLDRGQVGERELCLLLGSAVGAAPEEQERGLAVAAEREQGREVGIGGNDDAVLGACPFGDFIVAGGLEAVVANMRGVVAGGREALGDAR
jgi:hypothetical protein